jgi:hypothetical protein
MLTLFVEAIKTNPKLAIKLQKRRFEFVKVRPNARESNPLARARDALDPSSLAAPPACL